MNRYDRYNMLKQSFDILFPNAIPIKDDVDINRIIENKNRLLEEVKEKIKKVSYCYIWHWFVSIWRIYTYKPEPINSTFYGGKLSY